MVRALLIVVRLFTTVPLFEFAGAALITAGIWLEWGYEFGLIAAGGFALLKSLDLALAKAAK